MRVGAVGPGSLLGPCLWGRLTSPSGAWDLAGRGARAPREGTGYLWRQPSVGLQRPCSTSLALSLRDLKRFCQGLARSRCVGPWGSA